MNEKFKAWFPAFVFFLAGLFNLFHHELWRDEFHGWLIAIRSSSVSEVLENSKYDGHPGLWYLLLYFLSHFTQQYISMQIFHLFIATAAIFVFLKYSPFLFSHKLLFIFGYFPFFEYSVISRSYGLGMLLLFLFCAFFQKGLNKKYILLSSILFLLSQTNVYGLILSIIIAVSIAFELVVLERNNSSSRINLNQISASIIILISGIICSIGQMIQPEDSGMAVGWTTVIKPELLSPVISLIWKSFIPIPFFRISFWNTNIINVLDPWLQVVLAITLLLLIAGFFIRKTFPLILFLSGSLAIMIFIYTKYFGFLRHHGHLYLLFIASLWIAPLYPAKKFYAGFFEKAIFFFDKQKNNVLSVLFIVHIAVGLMANYMDFLYPFSAGKMVAGFLVNNKIELPLVEGNEYYAGITVAGYLNRNIYYPQSERWGSFVIFDKKSDRALPFSEIVDKSKKLSLENKTDVIILSALKQDTSLFPIQNLAWFSDSTIVTDERYFLYKIPFLPER